jgi:outer membrane receptor protein involved in Fe transport
VATYLFNPRYHLTEDTMLYVRVASGYRPGGPNFALNPTVPATFKSDQLWNYELGEKSTVLDGRGTINADIYDIEWSKLQATKNVDGINQLVNCCDARVEGAEVAFNYRVLEDLTLGGSGAYTNAETTTAAPVLGLSGSGARIPLSPRFNFAVSGDYAFDVGGFTGALNIDDVWVGDRTVGYNGAQPFQGNPQYTMPAYNTVNANLAIYLADNVELDEYAKNIFNTHGQVSATTVTDQYVAPPLAPYAPVPVILSQPRTIGLVFKISFGK